jgi:MinD superfamily P-loop ATPase
VQYSELTHYHLKQGSEFPNIKSLQCKFWVKCAGHCVDRCTLQRLRADKTEEKQRLCARCAPVRYHTRAPASKSSGKNSGSISPQSLMNLLLCRLAEASF